MPRINVQGSGHVGPRPVGRWQWQPFTNARYLTEVQRAFNIINARIMGNAPCNAAFQALPRGRSFANLWSDPNVWVSYDPDGRPTKFGGSRGTEITLSQYACRMGHWTLVATLIHELAHVGGASGSNQDAESTLKACLMRAHFNPYVLGSLQSVPRLNAGVVA